MEETLEVWRSCGDEFSAADALSNLGYLALVKGDHDAARSRLAESLTLADKLGDSFRVAMVNGNLGLVALAEERFQDALTLFHENLRRSVATHEYRSAEEAILGLAASYGALGESRLAVELGAAWESLFELDHGQAQTVIEGALEHIRLARAALDAPTLAELEARGRSLSLAEVVAEVERLG